MEETEYSDDSEWDSRKRRSSDFNRVGTSPHANEFATLGGALFLD